MASDQTVTEALLDAIQDAFNRHDVDGILGYFADDCEWVMARGPDAPRGRVCIGKGEIGEVLSSRYAVIPDMRWVDMEHWVMGDRAVSRWTVQGTTTDGTRLDWKGCDLWEFRAGKVVRKDTYWKTIE